MHHPFALNRCVPALAALGEARETGVADFGDYDAVGLAELVRRGDATARELVDWSIGQIEALDGTLNAVVWRRFEQARIEAERVRPQSSPLAGVPFLLKDYGAEVAGEPLQLGSRFWQGYRPSVDAELTRRFRAAGLIVLGRTNVPELAILGHTTPTLYGPCRNPWNPQRTAGGSSGGAAAAVAARMVPVAHASDGGGSIRIPASACGLVGLKPTRARVPFGPQRGEGWGGLAGAFAVSRTVRDTAALFDAVAGPARGDPYWAPPLEQPLTEAVQADAKGLRVAVFRGSFFGTGVDPECVAAVEDAAQLCRELGHEVREASPNFDRSEAVRAYLTLVAAGVAAAVDARAKELGRGPRADELELSTWIMNLMGQKLSALDLARARETMHRLGRTLAEFHQDHDVLLSATMAQPPRPLEALRFSWRERVQMQLLKSVGTPRLFAVAMEALAESSFEPTPNTQLFNLSGQPAVNVPLHWGAQGLPIGVQFAGRFGDEATLLQLAAQLEQARSWHARRPAVAASN